MADLQDAWDGKTEIGDRVRVSIGGEAVVFDAGSDRDGTVESISQFGDRQYIHVAYDEGWTGEVQSTDVADGLRVYRLTER